MPAGFGQHVDVLHAQGHSLTLGSPGPKMCKHLRHPGRVDAWWQVIVCIEWLRAIVIYRLGSSKSGLQTS